MQNLHRPIGFLTVLAVFTGLAELASAQVGGTGQTQLTCTTNAAVTPQLRGEGFTEATGDITINCTGGTAPTPGNAIPLVNIAIYYNTNVTSRLLPTTTPQASDYTSEALLLIDEPGSGLPGYSPSLPQMLCTTPLTGCQAYVGAVPGPTYGTAVSSGSTPAPNVYQGVVNGTSVTFFGVPVLTPGYGGSHVFRMTNVRVNAQPLAGGSSGATPVHATISISGAAWVPIDKSDLVVGYVSNGLSASAGNASTFSQCSSQTKTSAATLTFSENFGTAFKTRVFAQTNALYGGQINNPVQNVPGAVYTSESNFVFPINSTQIAGLTDYGTRLKATFNNVPPGARIFVSTANVNSNASPVTAPKPVGGSQANANSFPYVGYAQLVSGESTSDSGAGTPGIFPAVAATDYGPNNGNVPIVELAVVNGTASAVWEVVNTNPNTNESFKFAVYVTYAANPSQNTPAPGTATVNLSFAATAPSGVAADAGSPLPRFAGDSSAARAAFTIQACSLPASLGIAKGHTGNFTQGQQNATYNVTVSNALGAGPTSGPVTVTETVPAGLTFVSMSGTNWNCSSNTCSRSDVLAAGASYPPITVTVNVASNATSPQVNSVSVSGGGSAPANAVDSTVIGTCSYSLNPTTAQAASGAGTGTFSVLVSAGCPWTAASNASWLTVTSGTSGNGNGTVGYSYAANPNGTPRSATITAGGQTFTLTQAGTSALRFVPVTPCRIADTRNPTGPFGGPSLAAAISRDFDVLGGPCGIPVNAVAYSLNLTVVPLGPLGFLSVWPAGQLQPVVSTLNSGDGRIKANAAIVPAGVNGAITLFGSNATHVIVDINGYFVPASGVQNLAFYPITPCRLADTRIGTGTFGGPQLAAATSRDFPVRSGACGIPASALAYAFNMTVVPSGPLGFLSAWPAGSPQPGSSTLNAPTGTVTSNMAIVPAGTGGAITVIATNATDLIIDITGYFAPPGAGSLDFYTATPCRILDTRGASGTFGGPMMGATETRSFPVPASGCGIPGTAKAYSLNATVVPPAALGFLQLWGSGGQPAVSTLNSYDGTIVANAAVVPAGTSGVVTAFTSNASHLILDINGYFQ